MNKVVLLLDDNPGIRRDLGRRLVDLGYSVHTVETIDEAKKVILSEHIDFGVVDLKVDYATEYGGSEVVNFLKRQQPHAKAIVLSAYELNETIKAHFTVKVDGAVSKGSPKNYISAVIEQLDSLGAAEALRECFVIMPFSDTASCTSAQWTDIFENTITPAVKQRGLHYNCTRSEAIHGSIIESILDNLNRADLVIADLTDRNSNVFYELGVRHSLRDSTILIAQSLEHVPFDLRPYAVQTYDWKTKKGRGDFRSQLKTVIRALEVDPKAGTSPVRKYLRVEDDSKDRDV